MTESEKIAKLCEKADVTEAEARKILEQVDWDLLDAILLLERQGRLMDAAARYSTRRERGVRRRRRNVGLQAARVERRRGAAARHPDRQRNAFAVSRGGRRLFSLSITAMAILAVFANIWLLLALVVGLFLRLRFPSRANSWASPPSTTSWTRPPRPRRRPRDGRGQLPREK